MTLNEAFALAIQHYKAGRLADAAVVCRAILAAVPDQVETRHLLGVMAHMEGRTEEAVAAFHLCLVLRPDLPDALSNLGIARQAQGAVRETVRLLSRAIALAPSGGLHLNRGSAHQALGETPAATADFERAVALGPQDAMPRNGLGMMRRAAGLVGAAILLHRQAVALDPRFSDAWRDLGHALRESGRLRQAVGAYARAAALSPGRTEALSYQLFSQQAVCDWDDYEPLCQRIRDIIDRDAGVVLPFTALAIETTPTQQRRAAEFFHGAMVRAPGRPPALLPARPRGDPRLCVAYASADFHEHATAYLAAEMFELHDRERFRILAYSYGQDDGSPMRRRLVAAFDTFRDIRDCGIDHVARQVVEDGVDILVDLKGYTKQSRLDLLSRRLAPVQATYLGYPGTTGADVLDYNIGDRIVTPLEHQPFYSERLAVLPEAYQVNDRRRPLDGRVPTRPECGLPADGLVLCAFNTTYKITPTLFGAWMRLLDRLPGSVLWLYEANADAVGNLHRSAAGRGIDPARLVFAPKRPLTEHLARYRVADLGLDSFPYTGHTTTSDALWMGLPVVTLIGDTFASRVAASLLTAAGVPELVTGSLEAYEALVLDLAHDPAARAGLRRRLEEVRLTVPLFDSRRFTRHIERAYEIMWEINRAGQPPRPFAVPPLPSGTA